MRFTTRSQHLKSNPTVDWKSLLGKLEDAPKYFLREASNLYRQTSTARHRNQSQQQSRDDLLTAERRKDAEQQKRWQSEYHSASGQLWYSGDFKDKDERIQLLQSVRVVKRTAKQIHVIAAYTMYCCKVSPDSEGILWSADPIGGRFAELYTGWTPITRYRLLRIHYTRLFHPGITTDYMKGHTVHIDAWKRLCSICLFSNEDDYAKWHLARYEDIARHSGRRRNERAHRTDRRKAGTAMRFPHVVLGVEIGASRSQVTSAFRRLAMRHHPDRGGDPIEFHRVKKAYDQIIRMAAS
jgi:hypothetical protein